VEAPKLGGADPARAAGADAQPAGNGSAAPLPRDTVQDGGGSPGGTEDGTARPEGEQPGTGG
jgi:hypothetical protein